MKTVSCSDTMAQSKLMEMKTFTQTRLNLKAVKSGGLQMKVTVILENSQRIILTLRSSSFLMLEDKAKLTEKI
jgi:hypothetical protein